MKTFLKSLALVAASLSLISCGLFIEKGTIASLRSAPPQQKLITAKAADLNVANHQSVKDDYVELANMVSDKQLKEKIERRIAAVSMHEGDTRLASLQKKSRKSYYDEAIASYLDVLQRYPNSSNNAEVRYQLAKAYDMQGKQDKALKMLLELTDLHPHFPRMAEVRFRMGDIYFSNRQYAKAEHSYREMAKFDEQKFFINAYYMMGWAQYKLAKFQRSLKSFALVLDDVLGDKTNDQKNTSAKDKSTEIEASDIAKYASPLLQDTLHSMTLSMINTGGAEQIAKIDTLVGKPYISLVYENLGDFYLEKERYIDSAETYKSFIATNRDHVKAPSIHSKLINAYIKGGFGKLALPEKENFVNAYGIHSTFAHNPANGIRAELSESLHEYIDELAKYYHHSAQRLEKELAAIDQRKSAKKHASTRTKMINSFVRASELYDNYIDTFPKDQHIAEFIFLKGEALFSAAKFPAAIEAYEAVAYQLKGRKKDKNAVNAGYAAIIAFQKHIDGLAENSPQKKTWQENAVESMLRFTANFHQDSRSTAVLTSTAEYLFSLDRYAKALHVSEKLLKNNSELDAALKKTAHGIMAHSLFKLERYAEAATQYINQRQLLKKSNTQYAQITEKLATAAYRSAESLIAQDEKTQAVTQLLRVKALAPKTNIRVTAQYDAASLLLSLSQWDAAIVELKDLIAAYPQHELALEFPRKLAFAYEQSSDWKMAAKQYDWLYEHDPDEAIQQEALFLAAGFYEKIGAKKTAIKQYKRYAHQYEKPFANRMEARYHLARLYEELAMPSKQIFWLRRIVGADKKADGDRNERSKWLAAWANVKYGDYFATEFKNHRLRQPLERSLPKKNKFLKDATERYEMAVDYGILEFVTMSSYKMARLYHDFANDIIKSPRPKSLAKNQRAAYEQIIQEQSAPFKELAASIHNANIERAWQGLFDEWIHNSFNDMSVLSPSRFSKAEVETRYGNEIL